MHVEPAVPDALVAAVGGTEARARSVSILVILGVSMLGGLWVPAFLLPEWVRDAALASLSSWRIVDTASPSSALETDSWTSA